MQSAVTTGCAGLPASDPSATPASAAAQAAADVHGSDLRHYIRTYDNSLPPELCAKLIDSFNTLSRFQQRNGRGVRAGLDESAWTELDISRLSDAAFLSFFRQLISQALQRYNSDVGLPLAIPDSPLLSPLILKRYRAGDEEKFQTHFDSINEVCDRYLVFLWYLNDVGSGGQTWFPGLQTGVAPRAGRLLMFPPYWMYAHQGQPSPEQDKYILSTYLRFPQPQSSR
ncbi:2OG-Fe(II) oxygenase [Stenotrophomonas sp. SY1]|jgi:prolyl 4-hydroxylase|uniref:2OG-Fe(II) oxygenase n=1 Tax=Stenotrophomonas sp. SY1 TaxID=477235 RepID=UPI001E58B997|nr:2OG-Fe(II) oxygenase [Stenotrophomonas sp. SY1]MCD9086063.1 2OG-Fe(II) oxygenase [Stenotrophomonas sp. SY1]